jgi:hypothetical protein
MVHTIRTPDGLAFDAPPGFALEETTLALRAPAAPGLKEARALQPQLAIRPNLVVRRKYVPEGTSLEAYAGEMCGEIVKSVGGIEGMETSGFTFKDGTTGIVVAFEMQAMKGVSLVQMHALRLDAGVMTTLALTLDKNTPNDVRAKAIDALASATLEKNVEKPA